MVAIPPRQQEQTRQQGTARITPVREHYTTMRDATGNRLGGLLRALGCPLLGVLCAAPYYGSSEMSHVIPPHVFQVLKSHRWNCNVLGRRRKFGHPNYVRVLGCEARGSNSYVRSSAQHALHGARDASTRMHICGPTQNHGSTCANGARTTARPHAPTKIPAFPYQKAKTSPFQQHDLSILIVGPNQLKCRLPRTRKPKSRATSNTQCPITLL